MGLYQITCLKFLKIVEHHRIERLSFIFFFLKLVTCERHQFGLFWNILYLTLMFYVFRDINTERSTIQLWLNLNRTRCRHLKVTLLFVFHHHPHHHPPPPAINLITVLRCFQSVEGKLFKKLFCHYHELISMYYYSKGSACPHPLSDHFFYYITSANSWGVRNAQRKLVAYKVFTLKGKGSDKFNSVCKGKLQRLYKDSSP